MDYFEHNASTTLKYSGAIKTIRQNFSNNDRRASNSNRMLWVLY